MHTHPSRQSSLSFTALFAAAAPVLLAAQAHATAYGINTTNMDMVDDGKCSLLEAAQAINTLSSVNTNDCPAGSNSNNVITLQGGTFAAPVIYKTQHSIRIRRPVTINGGGLDRTIIAADFPSDTELLFFDDGIMDFSANLKGLTLRKDRADFATHGLLLESNSGPSGVSAYLTQVRITGFTAGGIHAYGAFVHLDSCLIEGNTNYDRGGAIWLVDGGGVAGGLWSLGSSIVNNSSALGGGGLYYQANSNTNLFNTTFAGNTANGGDGGAILSNIDGGGYIDFHSCTVANNTASTSGGGVANMALGSTPPHFDNSLIAKNSAPSGKDLAGWIGVFNSIVGDYNGDTAPLDNTVTTPVADPGILPLASTGWPLNLKTIPLKPTSPALEKSGSPSSDAANVDGRGWIRPQDGNQNGVKTADYGAYEYDALTFETESTSYTKSSDAYNFLAGDQEYSGVSGTQLAADAVNDFVTYNFPVPQAGIYNVKVRLKKNNNRAIFQVAVASGANGAWSNMGAAYDAYSASASFGIVDFGNVQFTAGGTKYLRFQVTGKNNASSGYQVYLDFIRLTKQ